MFNRKPSQAGGQKNFSRKKKPNTVWNQGNSFGGKRKSASHDKIWRPESSEARPMGPKPGAFKRRTPRPHPTVDKVWRPESANARPQGTGMAAYAPRPTGGSFGGSERKSFGPKRSGSSSTGGYPPKKRRSQPGSSNFKSEPFNRKQEPEPSKRWKHSSEGSHSEYPAKRTPHSFHSQSGPRVQHASPRTKPAEPKKPRQYHYYLFYKPLDVLSQFTSEGDHKTIADFGAFPKDVYPVGRLDADSEGLLLLTNDNEVKYRFTHPKFDHPKTYWAQVERIPTEEELQQLRDGVVIDGMKTKPAEAKLLEQEPEVPERSTPIRFRKNVPTSWIELTLTEGKNRQVRKMTASIGHPTLRLIRVKIGNLGFDGLKPGEWKEIKKP